MIRRLGRTRLITAVMAASVLVGAATSLSWGLPVWAVLAMLRAYYAAIMADSAALTSGAIAATPPELRGMMLGFYSMFGFTAALVPPTAFGLALDLAGGAAHGFAWMTGFTVLAAPNLIGILLLRRLAPQAPPLTLQPLRT